MKKFTRVLMLFSAILLFAAANSNAQIVVRARLGRPSGVVEVRGNRPSPRHVWISEEWTPRGNSYAYHPGYWAERPRPNAYWVSGVWKHHPEGWIWVRGHWGY